MACRLASPGPSDSDPYLGIIRTWFHSLACRLASPGPGNSGSYLGIIGTCSTAWPAGWPHLDLVILVPIWASPSPGDFVPHLDLIAVDPFLASPGTGDSDPICASPIPGDSRPYLGIIGTWFHCMACRLASPGPGEWGCHLVLTHTW